MSGNWYRPRDILGRFCRPGEEAAEIVRPVPRPRKAAKAWPKKKEAKFFRELGILCDLGLALKAAGLTRRVAEGNQGGAMVTSVLRGADVALPVKLVHASHGKTARAEPVAALFEGGRARFAGGFPELEDELAGLIAGGGYEGPGRSPDRADAMVWAMTDLMLGRKKAAPRIRQL